MCGQNNYLGKVTSYDMNESEMGYRGSKSSAIALVKEQRVDGSYSFLVGLLRCTLMAPVRGYQTEIPSNKNNISPRCLFAGAAPLAVAAPLAGGPEERRAPAENVVVTSRKGEPEDKARPKLNKLDPWFMTGFVDAEGFFSIELYKDSKAKFKYTPRLVFGINLHVKDLPILLSFKDTLGVGTVSTKGKVTSYTVKTFKDLAVIVNHFKLYPLVSSKYTPSGVY